MTQEDDAQSRRPTRAGARSLQALGGLGEVSGRGTLVDRLARSGFELDFSDPSLAVCRIAGSA